ncbi:MAG: peptidylprolyl isomerase, partial [Dehalococcoidales bacterium]|nr:peptidylprolyl isomerase [Dehalococcoidales bacterium]
MVKKSVVKPKRAVTRRQLSHWKRQKRRQRIIITLGISVIVAVVGLVTAGIYYQWYIPEHKPLRETVIEVNDTKFDMQYYIDTLNFQLGEYYPYVESYLDYALGAIEQNELIRQGAEKLGVTVSDDEVKEKLGSYEYDDTRAARDSIRASLLLEKLKEEYFGPKIPINAEHRHVMAMFLEGEAQVADVRDRLEDGEDFTEVAGELSLESTTREGGDLGWWPEGILDGLLGTTVLDSYIFGSQVGGLSQAVYDADKEKSLGYWLIKVIEEEEVEEEEKAVNVQAILLSSEEEAQEVLTRIEAGEEFVDLAEEFSQRGMTGEKADMGWIVEGYMGQAFEDYVFNPETEIEVVSEPILDYTETTTGGYWLFEVLGSEIMDISDEDKGILVDGDMDEW